MTKHFAARIPLILAALVCLAPLAVAAEDPPPLAEMWLFTPYPGKAAELAEAVRAHGAYRQEQGDPRGWQVYTPALGEDIGRVGVRFCCMQWADVDAYHAWESQNPAVTKHYFDTVEPLVKRTAHYFERMDWQHSHWNADGGPYKLFAVTEFRLKVGGGSEFDAARGKMSEIAKEQGWSDRGSSWIWATTVGGAPTEAIVIPYREVTP